MPPPHMLKCVGLCGLQLDATLTLIGMLIGTQLIEFMEPAYALAMLPMLDMAAEVIAPPRPASYESFGD